MSKKVINPKSIPYLEKFFETHKLFYVTDFPWQFFNAESANAFSTIVKNMDFSIQYQEKKMTFLEY